MGNINRMESYFLVSALLLTWCNAEHEKLQISSFTVDTFPVTKYVYGVLLGADVTLQCDVSGGNTHDVRLELRKHNKTIHSSQRSTGIMHILRNVTCEDAGEYVCGAQDSANSVSRAAHINVQFCPPRLCHINDSTIVVSASIGRDYTISTCIFTHVNSDQYPRISINGKTHIKKNSVTMNKYSFKWSKNRTPMYNTADLTIRDVTEADYGALGIELYITADNSLKYTVYILKPAATYNVDFTVKNLDAFASVSRPVTLSCHASAFKPTVTIYQRGNDTELARYTGSLTNASALLHTLKGTCSDTGAYVCQVEDVRGVRVRKEVVLTFKNCPPMPCSGESKSKVQPANVSDNITVSLCVLAYNGTDPAIDIDGVMHRIDDVSQRFHVDILNEGHKTRVNININGVQFKDFREHRVKISTSGQPASTGSTEFIFEVININNDQCNLYKRKTTVFTDIGGNATARFCVQHDERWLNETLALNEDTTDSLSNGQARIWFDLIEGQQYGFLTVDMYDVQLSDIKQHRFVTANMNFNYTVDLQLWKDSIQLCNNSDRHRISHVALSDKMWVHTCIAFNKSTSNYSIFVDLNGTQFKNMGCDDRKCAVWAPKNASHIEYIFSVKMNNLSAHDFGHVTTRVVLYDEFNGSVISELTFTLQIERLYVESVNKPEGIYDDRSRGDQAVQSDIAPNTILVITMAITCTLLVAVVAGYVINKFRKNINVFQCLKREQHVVGHNLSRPNSDGVPSRELQPMYLNTEQMNRSIDV